MIAPAIRHRLQSQWDTPNGWVLARSDWYATWAVVVADPAGNRVVARHDHRGDAEAHAAQLAAQAAAASRRAS